MVKGSQLGIWWSMVIMVVIGDSVVVNGCSSVGLAYLKDRPWFWMYPISVRALASVSSHLILKYSNSFCVV